MKKYFLFLSEYLPSCCISVCILLSVLLLPGVSWLFPMPVSAETILTATDLHHLTEELTDDGPAFLGLLERADGKITQYSTEIISAFLDKAVEIHPDVLLLTGDLSFNGETLSHRDLARMLKSVEDAGIPVLVLPGNHDLNYSAARAFSGDEIFLTDTPDAGEFAEIYAPFGYDEALSRDPSSLSYVWKLSDRLWILCVDVNTPEAPGILTENTLSWIREITDLASASGAALIGASHQNLLAHNSLFTDGFRMGNADSLLSVYQEAGVRINLSGHMHVQHISIENGVTDIATSALTMYPLHYALLEVQEGGSFSYQAYPLELPEGAGLTAETAADWFDHCGKLKLDAQLGSPDIPQDIRKQMRTETLLFNRAYFSGHMNTVRDAQGLLALWQKYDPAGLTQIYIRSILEDPAVDMTHFKMVYSGLPAP